MKNYFKNFSEKKISLKEAQSVLGGDCESDCLEDAIAWCEAFNPGVLFERCVSAQTHFCIQNCPIV